MNLFSPYKIITNSDEELHLQETKGRKRFMFIFFRIVPFFLAALVAVGVSNVELPREFRYILLGCALLILVVFLFKQYVTEVKIGRTVIEATTHSFLKIDNKVFLIKDIEKITLLVHGGKSGGMFYKLKMKDGSSKTLFTIPVLYMSKERIPLINEKLYAITGLEVHRLN